ncbi:MAG: DEAD/DEAH box helicase [Methylacidiphilales bacterium]|nr:DEAD/DEAH box helicase [Candidatus Methylacidiphilales bacterium]
MEMDMPRRSPYPDLLAALLNGVIKNTMSFQNLGLEESVVHAVQRLRYVEPTPIQTQAIPVILENKDLLGSAQTGTGKTAAFALPIISRLKKHSPRTRCLILEPTRELAAQVNEALADFSAFTDVKTCLLHGGVKYERQNFELARHPDIIVATPGRLLDHIENGAVKLNQVETLVLDEADRMLDMGFMPDVRRIIGQCPTKRQTLLFSATISPQLQNLIAWAMREPVSIDIGQRYNPAETIQHVLYPVAMNQKFDLLLALLDRTNYESVIIFSRTKMGADQIAATLKTNGHNVEAIHSDRTQSQRTQVLEMFREGKVEVLVATDIAARGLDINGVTHVINYDVPENPEDYVHRIGRTGRAQKSGDAMTLFTAAEQDYVSSIERLIEKKIPRTKLDNFDYTYTTLLQEDAKAGMRSIHRKPSRRRR